MNIGLSLVPKGLRVIPTQVPLVFNKECNTHTESVELELATHMTLSAHVALAVEPETSLSIHLLDFSLRS
jgi:hypothetical protein